VTIDPERQGEHRLIPASSIELVVETRLRELFELIRRQLTDSGAYSWLSNRIYLSGGGAKIPQVCDLAATVFNRPVSIAQPYNVSCLAGLQLQPQHNTVIGLLRAGRRDLQVAREVAQQKSLLSGTVEWWKNAWKTIADW
jgi:cell division ATPase FtsA